jgi:DNA-binding transcriptional MerR regulator
MAEDRRDPDGKLFWTIGEVAAGLGVNQSLIRYWEKEFGMIRPKRTGRGDRLYTRKEIELLKRIQRLVKEEGYTLNGAKARLRKAEEAEAAPLDVATLRERLLGIRLKLIELARNQDPA